MADNDWIKDEFAEIKAMLIRVDEAIRGNGKEGLVTRVSKLEWAAKLLFWLGGAMAIPVVGMVVKTIYEHLTKH